MSAPSFHIRRGVLTTPSVAVCLHASVVTCIQALGEGGAIFTTLGAVLEESRNFFRNNVPDDVA